MKSGRALTRKDLIVVVGCLVFVLMNMGIIAPGGRQRAKEAVCLSNLLQWGVIFQMYAGDNEGKFSGGIEEPIIGEHAWVWKLLPYYKNRDICLCPAAPKTWTEINYDADGDCTFLAWGVFSGGEFMEPYDGAYGSYGKNTWCSQWTHGFDPTGGTYNWRNINEVQNPARVPLFLGCILMGGFPIATHEPPPWSGAFFFYLSGEMGRYCLNRHNGYVNGLFVDLSARKIGLKELWTLKWHRQFDTQGPWTEAGGCQPEDWPEWMRDL